jgi:hypothetical protein
MAALIIISVVTAILTAKQIEGKIKELFVAEINKRLNTEVNVQHIEFTFLENFPYATLKFEDVSAKDALGKPEMKRDTLLKAGNIMLNFNLFDIYRGNYRIKRIDLTDAKIKLKVYKDLSDNFHVIKASGDSTDSRFSFQLQKINLKNVAISYRNSATLQDYSFHTKGATLRGAFSEKQYDVKVKGAVDILKIKSADLYYVKDKLAHINMNIAVDQQSGTYRFSKGLAEIGDLKFEADGKLVYTDSKKQVNATIVSSEAELGAILAELPEHIRTKFKDYEPRGILAFTLKIDGGFGGSSLPCVEARFNLKAATIKNLDNKINLENFDAEGVYNNGSSEDLSHHSLQIKSFSGQINNSTFNGKLALTGFRNAEISAALDARLNLSDLAAFLNITSLQDVNGTANIKGEFSGKVADPSNLVISDFFSNKVSGEVTFDNLSAKSSEKFFELSEFSGQWAFSNNDILVKSTRGKVSGCDISLSGSFNNILPYLFLENQHLQVNANLDSKRMDLDKLLATSVKNNDTTYSINFPLNLDLDLKLRIGQLNFRSFYASNVESALVYRNSKFYLNGLNMNAFGGTFSLSGMMDGSKKGSIRVSTEMSSSKTDIYRLFHELGNFGQDYVLDENLKGTADITLQLQFLMNGNLQIQPASILANSDLHIVNGELINYKTIYSLGKFIRVDDLSRIKFSELKNQFMIKDSKVIIPEMDVKSDALNFSLSGTHTFKNEINYKIRLLLSDLLYKKAKAAKKENTEFGIEEEDAKGKTTLYVLLTGTVDKPLFRYDSKSVKGKIVANLLNEKQNLKSIFKSEFSKSQKEQDSIKIKEKEKLRRQEKGEFIVEWEGVEADSALLGRKKNQAKEKKSPVKAKKDVDKPALKVDWE